MTLTVIMEPLLDEQGIPNDIDLLLSSANKVYLLMLEIL